ncbi:hypothetical protein [Candidatus Solirubrobacter pratensis]|uniref:hypothetical protein n=1 Tax=Candidatus Solirubrobacter pratensis TaxID=1298857 RepID=UPI00041DEC15|nr:hypothetical protein [Candidatus Solirubrobacter pratensis]
MPVSHPFTTSLEPETWFKGGSGIDKETGEPFALVVRNKNDRATTWTLRLTTNRNGKTDWRAVAHTTSQGETVVYPSPRNLSHSHIDTHLRNVAQPGEWVGTRWSPR